MNGQNHRPISAIKALLIINIIVYFLQQSTPGYTEMFTVSAQNIADGEYWRLVTSMFAHGDFMHILFNMYGLYLFGQFVEPAIGNKRFVILYLLSGLLGNLAWLSANWYIPAGELYNLNPAYVKELAREGIDISSKLMVNKIPLLGASGSVFGILAAAAIIAPNVRFQLIIPPIPMKLRTLAIFYTILELYQVADVIKGDNIAHLAHLGGMLGGFIICHRQLIYALKSRKRKAEFTHAIRQTETKTLHQCAVCGITEKDDEEMHFRVCVECGKDFCMDHLSPHPHGMSDEKPADSAQTSTTERQTPAPVDKGKDKYNSRYN